MSEKLNKLFSFSFYLLFFLTPLAFYWRTSELFEFNKMIVVYIFTVIICSLWIIRMIIEKKLVFVRSILDIPILIFLFSQILSTVFSIDSRTSILGFYSRFHGGFFFSISFFFFFFFFLF